MDAQIQQIKTWLGIGSINIFGLPMSGKDTVGVQLAEKLGAKFLSSGMIVRAMEKATGQNITGNGKLMPSNVFYEWAVALQLSDQDVVERWEAAKLLGDRGLRADDADPQVFQTRITEYHEKTLPVLQRYQELGLLVSVPANGTREQVLANVIEALANFASHTNNFIPEL